MDPDPAPFAGACETMNELTLSLSLQSALPYASQWLVLVRAEVARDLCFDLVVILRPDTESHGDWPHFH